MKAQPKNTGTVMVPAEASPGGPEWIRGAWDAFLADAGRGLPGAPGSIREGGGAERGRRGREVLRGFSSGGRDYERRGFRGVFWPIRAWKRCRTQPVRAEGGAELVVKALKCSAAEGGVESRRRVLELLKAGLGGGGAGKTEPVVLNGQSQRGVQAELGR